MLSDLNDMTRKQQEKKKNLSKTQTRGDQTICY